MEPYAWEQSSSPTSVHRQRSWRVPPVNLIQILDTQVFLCHKDTSNALERTVNQAYTSLNDRRTLFSIEPLGV
jgi:hypothetical protein